MVFLPEWAVARRHLSKATLAVHRGSLVLAQHAFVVRKTSLLGGQRQGQPRRWLPIGPTKAIFGKAACPS